MSAVTRPRGPLPAKVYWTRRGIVLGAALLLVVVFGQVLGGGSDGSSDDGGKAATVAAGQQASRTSNPRTTAPAPAAKQPRQAAAPLAAPDGPCDPQDITVQPLVQRAPAGGEIRIPFDVRGTEPACTWTLSAKTLVVKITSGDDGIWSSQQCPAIPTASSVVVRSAAPTRIAMVWNGRRSNEDCSRTATWAVPGWYHVVVAALGGEPTDKQFQLVAPPRPRVTQTVQPKPAPKPPAPKPPAPKPPAPKPTATAPAPR